MAITPGEAELPKIGTALADRCAFSWRSDDHFPDPPHWCRSNDGVIDVRLAHSRDGKRWSYIGGTHAANATHPADGDRRPWIARSSCGLPVNSLERVPDGASWACSIVDTVRGFVVRGDEIWLYVFGSKARHGQAIAGTGEIRRFTLRLDGCEPPA